MLQEIKKEIRKYQDKERATFNLTFYKTHKGGYGEGDKFLGLTVPNCRKIAKQYKELSLEKVEKLLQSPIHDERLIALLILISQFRKGDEKVRKEIYNLYYKNRKYVNNWDLVDLSAHEIMGGFLQDKNKYILFKLAESKNLFERRIAMLATFYDIKKGKCDTALKMAEKLVFDKHDLMHKAVGWMLREIGKNCGQENEEAFLKKYYMKMPRTMLRYAIEKFPEKKRLQYLKGKI